MHHEGHDPVFGLRFSECCFNDVCALNKRNLMEIQSCNGCIYSTQKRRFLGWRIYCNRFHCLRDARCIDFRSSGEQKPAEPITKAYKDTECNRW